MSPFLILLVNLGATVALWFEMRRALEMSWRTSAAYAFGLVAWWLSAILPAMDIGAFLEAGAR